MFSTTWLVLFALSASPQLILPSGLSPLSLKHRNALENEQAEKGSKGIRNAAFVEYFIGFQKARLPDLKAVQALAQEAAELEAHFDTLGANRLRSGILELYQQTPRPTLEFRHLVAQIGHDLIAGWLTEGNQKEARSAARYTLSYFATYSIDPKRHSPAVRSFYDQERKRVDETTQVEVELILDQPGTLFIEGDNRGVVSHRWKGTLLAGDYRVWLRTSQGWSLPHHLSVREKPVQESISTQGQWCIRLAPYPHLDCGDQEAVVVKKLLALFPVEGVTIVDYYPGEKLVERRYDSSGFLEEYNIGYLVSGDEAMVSFGESAELDPLRYIPLGIGQWVQGRNLMGSAFLVSILGLGIWHGMAIDHYEQARFEGRLLDYADARFQQNLSAGLLYGVVIGSALEAILADYLE